MTRKTLAELVDEFCSRDVAPATRSAYGYPLRTHLLPFCRAHDIERPDQLDPDAIDRFGALLQRHLTSAGAPLAPASRRAYMKAVQQFLGWLRTRHGVAGPEPRLVQVPGLRKVHREVLSRAELQRLEDAAPSERNKLLVRLMGDTGAREGEVAAVHLDDLVQIDGRHFFVRVRGKTGQRLPPVRPELFRRLRAYAAGKTGRPRTRSPYLFMAERRRPGGLHEPLTEDGVYHAVRDAVLRAELGRRVYPHLLRHSAITWMVRKGMHPALVSEITGVSISVIASHYNHPSSPETWEAMSRLWD